MIRIQKLARERFQPYWSGAYRLERLIENQRLLPSPAKVKGRGPPLIIRSADRPNDTHILAAVFAFEMALSQPINQRSPYFRKDIHYLIDKDLDQEKALLALRNQSPFVDAVATQSSGQRENNLLTARVDISQGMMGRRVFVVRKQNMAQFKNVQTLNDLRSFRICIGAGWPDRQVMEAVEIPLVVRTFTRSLYEELQQGRCDAVSHTIYEARDEVLARPLEDLAVEPYLMLSYPATQQIFFSNAKGELAHATERGLQVLQKKNILHELLEVIYGDSIQYVQLNKRRVLTLSNPNLTRKLSSRRLEFQPLTWF